MNYTFGLIRRWAHDRNLITGATPVQQLPKLREEVDELEDALARNHPADINDAIGDCVVVLTIIAEQRGVMIEECIAGAYEEIRFRTGRMVDGIFVKDE